MKRKHNPRRLQLICLFIAALVFIITAFMAGQRQFFPLEREVFFAFYDLPRILLGPMWLITQFGSGLLLVALSIYFLIGRKRSQQKGTVVAVYGAITYLVVEIAKLVVARDRPNILDASISQHDLLKLHDFGFPSGHTALATILSLTLMHYLPRQWRWLPWVWIPLVAVSRLYLGVHAPLDIIGGFTLAIAIYCAGRLLQKD